jgi:hypothetical protein
MSLNPINYYNPIIALDQTVRLKSVTRNYTKFS